MHHALPLWALPRRKSSRLVGFPAFFRALFRRALAAFSAPRIVPSGTRIDARPHPRGRFSQLRSTVENGKESGRQREITRNYVTLRYITLQKIRRPCPRPCNPVSAHGLPTTPAHPSTPEERGVCPPHFFCNFCEGVKKTGMDTMGFRTRGRKRVLETAAATQGDGAGAGAGKKM